MKVADFMARGVITLTPEDSVHKAAKLMLQYEVNGFPVLEHGRLAGIVTEGDFLRRTETGTERQHGSWLALLNPGQLADEYAHTHGRKVGEVMTRDVVTVGENASLEEAVTLMEKHAIKQLPVVSGDALIGILGRRDLLRAFLTGSPEPGTKTNDAALSKHVASILDAQPWAPRGSVAATVENGVVDLRGVVDDERQKVALRIAMENIPGVRGVRDHLVEPEQGA